MCPCCGGRIEVYFCGKISDFDPKAIPQSIALEICDDCKELSQHGLICISVKDGTETKFEPVRSGAFTVLPRNILNDLQVDTSKEFVFVPDALWDKSGFPRSKENNDV